MKDINLYPCDGTRPWKVRFFDSSLSFILISIGFSILAGMFLMMLFTSCTSSVKKKEGSVQMEMAEQHIRLMSDHPESVRIIAFSKIDSVYGKNFFNNEELMEILDNLTHFNEMTFGNNSGNIDFDNPKMAAKIRRGASLSDLVQSHIGLPDGNTDFSGWKMKVLYKCTDAFNDTIKNERYFIFDKDMKYILHSFEIPIL